MNNFEYAELAEQANKNHKILKNNGDGTYSFLDYPSLSNEEILKQYDQAIEDHLKEERNARGYTSREPDVYLNSNVERWKQDAQDWIAHRDACMTYGQEAMNNYKSTGEIPNFKEFKNEIPNITWTIE